MLYCMPDMIFRHRKSRVEERLAVDLIERAEISIDRSKKMA
jgi:hypothetical protein